MDIATEIETIIYATHAAHAGIEKSISKMDVVLAQFAIDFPEAAARILTPAVA